MDRANAAATEYAALMFDPFGYAWIGNDSFTGEDLLVDDLENQFVTDLNEDIAVSIQIEEAGTNAFRSSFADISLDDPLGWGEGWGQSYGGGSLAYSTFCDSATEGNSLVNSGGNGYVPWAEQAEIDPVTGTTNKAQPIKQYQDSGIKRGQPLPRQFFNWMMAKIDDWFNFIDKRNSSVGTIKVTADLTQTATDFDNRFGGTWVLVGTRDWTVSNETTNVFKRTA